MSGENLQPHNHEWKIQRYSSDLIVQYGDTGLLVFKRGPLLRWRIQRAMKITKSRHDRGTARERRIAATVAEVVNHPRAGA